MLRKPTAEEAEKYIDFAYDLALDPSRSGYPTYTDGIKTKEDFIEVCRYGLERDDRKVLLYLENNVVAGWIQLLFEKEGRYLETSIFNIAGDTGTALKEFTEHCEQNYPDYDICLGFPKDNRDAVVYLTDNNWLCEEESYNNVLFFDNYELLPESENIVRVTKQNFSDFAALHAPIEGSMYWNCERLYDCIDDWDIYVYYVDGEPTAAIYNRDAKTLMHIYGVDYKDNVYIADAFRILMTKVLNVCKRNGQKYMVFFGEDQDQQEALKLGYTCVGEYILFTKRR